VVEEDGVWVLTVPWTEGVVVGAGCSAEAGVRESACSVGAGEAEKVVRVPLFGKDEEVLRERGEGVLREQGEEVLHG
jgi:hypothetical protein